MAQNHVFSYVFGLFASLLLAGLVSAQATSALCQALNNLCADIQDLIPITAMLLIIASGVVYSLGQIFGSETRARATVWATSCLTGAIIGILISTIAPTVLSALAGPGYTVDCVRGRSC